MPKSPVTLVGHSVANAKIAVAIAQGSVNGGFQTVVRVFWGNEIPLPPFHLNFTSFLPQFYLFLNFFYLFLTSI